MSLTSNPIIDLFEPKLPPINLWCLPSAHWFYRNTTSQDAVPTSDNQVSVLNVGTMRLILKDR